MLKQKLAALYTTVLILPVGIWPETVDGTDLVVGAKSLSGTQFVAGDDFGKLKLYNYPVAKPKVTLDQPHNCFNVLTKINVFKVKKRGTY